MLRAREHASSATPRPPPDAGQLRQRRSVAAASASPSLAPTARSVPTCVAGPSSPRAAGRRRSGSSRTRSTQSSPSRHVGHRGLELDEVEREHSRRSGRGRRARRRRSAAPSPRQTDTREAKREPACGITGSGIDSTYAPSTQASAPATCSAWPASIRYTLVAEGVVRCTRVAGPASMRRRSRSPANTPPVGFWT